ncbi:MAG TPA: Rieske 2Fe-2S domain-containing protein [Ktedonobacteraceae bacterium]|nr:Rieske 2Fe-2S domain-containing protein [Ktedonobacteraceae bacterium]
MQKRCPHMKADLTRFAVIEDGILTCRLHNWQYELATGRCLTSEGHTLYAKRIEQDDRPDEPSAIPAD